MKIIFFGLGSIGLRHVNILQENYPHDLFAFRSGIKEEANNLGIKEIYSWDEVKTLKPDIAFITNPTSLHVETAIKCAEIECKLFIEKPIDKDLDGLDKLLDIVKKKHLVTYVAYCLRFNSVLKKLKEYINTGKVLHLRAVYTSFYPLWRPDTEHLKAYSAHSGMGGGVILDLSHELDYVSWLLGPIEKIGGNFSKRSKVTINTEDWADILVSAELAPASIHVNFFSQLKQRYVQIDFENLTVIGDLVNSEIKEYEGQTLARNLRVDPSGQEYEEQIKYFFDNINNPGMMNNLIEAADLFKKIILFKEKKI